MNRMHGDSADQEDQKDRELHVGGGEKTKEEKR